MSQHETHTRAKTVDLQTDYGTEARYIIGLYPGTRGMNLMRRLMQMTTPAAGLIDTLVRAVAKSGGIDSGGGDQGNAIEEVLSNIDGAGIDGILRDLVKGLGDEGDARLMIEILSCVVTRQAASPVGQAETSRGMDTQTFDRVYQGNYGEMLKACYHCVEHNFGPALRAFAEGNVLVGLVSGVLDRLKDRPSSDTSAG